MALDRDGGESKREKAGDAHGRPASPEAEAAASHDTTAALPSSQLLTDSDFPDLRLQPSEPRRFYVLRNRRRLGPYAEQQIADLVVNDILLYSDLAIHDGLEVPQPLSSLIALPERRASPTETSAPFDPSLDIRDIYVTHESRRSGPFSLVQAHGLVESGMLSPADAVTYRGCFKPMALGALLAAVDRALGPTQRIAVDDLSAYASVNAPTRKMPSLRSRRTVRRIVAMMLAVAVAAILIGVVARSRTARAEQHLYVNDEVGSHAATALVRSFLRQERCNHVAVAVDQSTTVVSFRGNEAARSVVIESAQSERVGARLRGGGRQILLGFDALVVIVNAHNPISAIGADQLAAIVRGETQTWTALGTGLHGAVVVCLRDPLSRESSSLAALLRIDPSETPPVRRYDTDSALDAAVAQDTFAIGIVSFAFAPRSKALAIRDAGSPATKPSEFAVRTETYPLARRIMVFSADGGGLSERLARFVRSDAGEQTVLSAGLVPCGLTMDNIPPPPSPARYRELMRGARRLSVTLRLEPGTMRLDATAVEDIARICGMLKQPDHAGLELALVGLWGAGENGDASVEASVKVAQTAAGLFEACGIRPSLVTGFGAESPLTQDRSTYGELRNRRIELWVRDRSASDRQHAVSVAESHR